MLLRGGIDKWFFTRLPAKVLKSFKTKDEKKSKCFWQPARIQTIATSRSELPISTQNSRLWTINNDHPTIDGEFGDLLWRGIQKEKSNQIKFSRTKKELPWKHWRYSKSLEQGNFRVRTMRNEDTPSQKRQTVEVAQSRKIVRSNERTDSYTKVKSDERVKRRDKAISNVYKRTEV